MKHELNLKDLDLGLSDLGKLYAITRTTDAAIGTLTGSPSNCTLTYQLYELPTNKPVDPPETVSGTELDILKALPAIAEEFDSEFGIKSPSIPKTVNATPAQITELGRSMLQFAAAVRLDPYDDLAWTNFATVLDFNEDYSQSIAVAKCAIDVCKRDEDTDNSLTVASYNTMADDELHLKNWTVSLADTNEVPALDGSDQTAQENIAEADWGEGLHQQAIAQWKIAANFSDRYVRAAARKLLAEHG